MSKYILIIHCGRTNLTQGKKGFSESQYLFLCYIYLPSSATADTRRWRRHALTPGNISICYLRAQLYGSIRQDTGKFSSSSRPCQKHKNLKDCIDPSAQELFFLILKREELFWPVMVVQTQRLQNYLIMSTRLSSQVHFQCIVSVYLPPGV